MFVPTLRECLLSLPVRSGGMGIPILTELCESEYQNSKRATQQLTERIKSQQEKYDIDDEKQKEIQSVIKKEKTNRNEKVLKYVRASMTKEEVRATDIAQMKGASSWLKSLPLKDEGYNLSKREFFDALYLRYRCFGIERYSRCGFYV